MSQQIQAVIFDCDGVLVDSEQLMTAVLFESLADTSVSVTMQQVEQHIVGKTTAQFHQFFADFFPGQLSDAFFHRHAHAVNEAFQTRLQPIAGAQAILQSLTVPFACASNSELNSLKHKLQLVQLRPYFNELLFAGDQVAKPKPAPDVFLLAASELGVAPQHCLVIEDSATGVQAAIAAGMSVVGHSLKPQPLLELGALAVFASMPDIQSYLAKQFDIIR